MSASARPSSPRAATHDAPSTGGLGAFLERRIAYILVFPTVVGILLVDVYPLLFNLWISFQERKISSATATFIGFRNYQRILADPEVWNAIWISIIFTVASVFFSFIIGFGLALLLNRQFPFRGIVRSVFIIPWAIPAFVAALVWAWMFNDQFGILAALFRSAGWRAPIWLGKDWALWSLIAVMVWKSFPFQLVVLLAGLQSIPKEQYEAAAVDGANVFQRFWSITLPLVKPVAMVGVLLAAVNAFHYFTIPWILTRGGPANATNVIPIATYNIAFIAGDFGYAAAAAVLMFLFILLISGIYIWQYIREVQDVG
ncbi:MAG: sugar ABC transporter permease [Chloroflexi bacterium]|nr:sugar ABC transporter permease [Chloroflexota bacterium]